ncbi:dihydroneopterin aldolase [Candidatus Latescibacterota bacterium]
MKDTLRIIGLMFNARHGVRPEEKTLTQPFEVDVEIIKDLSGPAESDRIDDTIDYSTVVDIVRKVIYGEHCRLIEKLAALIIEELSDIVHEGELIVRIRKPRAPIDIPFKTIEVELRREINR